MALGSMYWKSRMDLVKFSKPVTCNAVLALRLPAPSCGKKSGSLMGLGDLGGGKSMIGGGWRKDSSVAGMLFSHGGARRLMLTGSPRVLHPLAVSLPNGKQRKRSRYAHTRA
jgi:hypothetical protein